MRILLYSANYAPEPTGIGKYSGEMAVWLTRQGHEVRVVCAPPYYPGWKVDPGYSPASYLRETLDGVDIWRAPLWVPKVPGGLKRVLHLLSFALTSFPVMMRQIRWRPEMVICIAPALVCAPAGLLVARLCRAKAWLHLQDFEVDVAFRMKLLQGKLLQRIILRMERAFLRRFNVVSTISGRMVELLLAKGVPAERTFYFPNWVDTSKFKLGPSGSAYRDELGISKAAKVVLFSGSLGGKQGLRIVPKVAKILAERTDVVFLVCGDGLMKPHLEAEAATLPNLVLLPLQPMDRLGELLSTADIHLLPQSPDAADLVLPSKLSGMLASGRPIIATCWPNTEIASVVSKCGRVVPPNDATALAAAICELADSASTRNELGRHARQIAEQNFEIDAVLTKTFAAVDSDVSNIALTDGSAVA